MGPAEETLRRAEAKGIRLYGDGPHVKVWPPERVDPSLYYELCANETAIAALLAGDPEDLPAAKASCDSCGKPRESFYVHFRDPGGRLTGTFACAYCVRFVQGGDAQELS